MELWRDSQAWMCRPSELIGYSGDHLAALMLDKSVRMFGAFVDAETSRFANASKETGGSKKKIIRPTEQEVTDYNRALIDGRLPRHGKRMRLGGRDNKGGGSRSRRARRAPG